MLKKTIAIILVLIFTLGTLCVTAGAILKDGPYPYETLIKQAAQHKEQAEENISQGDFFGAVREWFLYVFLLLSSPYIALVLPPA